MITAIILGGYGLVSLSIFVGSGFFPRIAKKIDNGPYPPIEVISLFWPVVLCIGIIAWPVNRLYGVREYVLAYSSEEAKLERQEKRLARKQVKQLPAPIDVEIEQRATTYRHADCQGCGRPLQ